MPGAADRVAVTWLVLIYRQPAKPPGLKAMITDGGARMTAAFNAARDREYEDIAAGLMRPEPAPQVANWVRDRDRRELRTTSITLAQVRYGFARLPDGRRKQALLAAADEVFSAFEDQVLPLDIAAASGPGNRAAASMR